MVRRRSAVGLVAATAGIIATYPMAVAGQLAFERLLGDALLVHVWLCCSRRTVARDLLAAWIDSLPWVLILWLTCVVARARLGRAYTPTVGALCVALLGASLAAPDRLPSIFAWLATVAFALEAATLVADTMHNRSCV
jgi:hypothetical protein